MATIFTIAFIATLSIMKLKYKSKLSFDKAVVVSAKLGIIIYVVFLIISIIIIAVIGVHWTFETLSMMIAGAIGELIGWMIGVVIYGAVMYAFARYVIVYPIRYLIIKIKRA